MLLNEDQFNFNSSKAGYLAHFYQEEYICTLEDIVRERRDRRLMYKESELIAFFQIQLKFLA